MKLKDRVAIVTGAGSGIGRGIAEVFALEEGAKVVIAERSAASGKAVADAITAKGGTALFAECDVADEANVNAMVQSTLDAFGAVDVLINNAGVNFVKPFDQMTTADWDRVIGVDLRGVFLCIRACIDTFLKQQRGSVVTVSSVHSIASLPAAAPYDAAKWGVVGLTKSLAVEYAARNIRFNTLSPGLIDTQIWADVQAAASDLDACKSHWWANIPAGRVGTGSEMGRIAAFLASDDAAYITGHNLAADGGMTAQLVSKEQFESKPVEGN